MKDFTIFRTGSQRGVNTFMSGEGAIEHPMSTHSAPFGTSWKARGWRYLASILMILTLCVGNAWAIDWVNYSAVPESNGEYYLFSENAKYFFNTPTEKIYTSTSLDINGTGITGTNPAILFKMGTVSKTAEGKYSITTISFQKNSTTYYLHAVKTISDNANWLKTTGAAWNLEFADATLAGTYYSNTNKDPAYYMRTQETGSYSNHLFYAIARTNSSTKEKCGQLATRASLDTPSKKAPWLFISPEAYEDATGTQYYYTVEAQVYTNGAASSTGGSMKMAPRTYKKPAVADWTYPGDYVDAIDKKVKGGLGGFAVVNIYCQVSPNSGYNFTGFKDATNTALEESSEKGTYTYLPNTYELVDDVNGIYRVSLRVNGADADHPTEYKLRACFTQAAEPVAYEYNANNEKIAEYTNLATAFSSAAAGSRIELRKDISNVSSAFTIAKNLTLDFNNHTITGAADIMIQITDGNVTFVDNSTSGVGGLTTGGDVAVLVSGGSLTINDGKYVGATYAVERTGGSVTIKNGGFESNGTIQDINGTITLNGGFFYNSGALDVTSDYAVVTDIPTGMKYTTKDYRYMVVKKTSSNYPRCVVISEKTDTPKDTMRINFNSLEGAIAYVNNNADDDRVKTIIMRENCTLDGGKYTIPQYTTLVIPYSADQSMAHPHVELTKDDNEPEGAYRTLMLQNGAHIDIYGALEIGGRMTGGASAAQGELGIARPSAPRYGLLTMESGTSITLCDSASLNAWGYVQGAGTIDVRRGATVREMFQINDWKGYSATTAMVRVGAVDYTYKVLPVNQYFIQNVEVKTTYRPGSRLLGQVTVKLENLPNPVGFNDVGIIGVKYSAAEKAAYAEKNPGKELKDDVAIFLMDNEDTSEDTWVCKSYDVANDIQLYEVNNSAHLGSLLMTIDMTDIYSSLYIDADSREFVLPITNNFKIHLLYGNLYVTQDTELLPGAEIEINKKGTLTINKDSVWNGEQGKWRYTYQTLYLYDKDQWGTYVYKNKEGNDYNFGYASRIRYRHGGLVKERTLTPEGLGDAKLTVHGTVDVRGYLKTTQGDWYAVPDRIIIGTSTKKYATTCTATELVEKTTGGASITSTIADAGTIILSTNAGNVGTTGVRNYLWQVNSVGDYIIGEPDYYGDHVEPALLKNANGTYTSTKNKLAGNSFCYIDFDGDGMGEWKCLTDEGCFVKDENNVYYIKPQAYVPLSQGSAPVAEADHTYRDHYAGTNKIFILLDDCQWWEVKAVEGHPELFKCEHPDNTTFYYWDDSAADPKKHKWAEKKYKVEWKDWDGSDYAYKNKAGEWVNYYYVTYHTTPEWYGNVPAREMDDNYTYEFTGWSPTPAPVEEDVVYTATYESKVRSYMITFKDKAGNVIENQYVDYGTQPSCKGYTLAADEQWNPAVGIVTKDQIYQVDDMNPGPFTITFVNWNGNVLKTATNVAKNTSAAAVAALYNIDAPTKPETQDETFTFNGWTPAIVEATADAVYTATFRVDPQTYEIKFYDENNVQLGVTQNLAYGAMPTVPDYSKTATAEATYTLSWRDGEDKAILVGVATQDQSYYAHFDATTRQYEVRWINEKGEVFDAQSLTYGSTPTYHGVTPTQAADAAYRYEFAGSWKDENETTYDGSAWATVAGNQTYTAQFTPHSIEPLVIENAQTVSDNQEVVEVRITTTGSLNVTGKITTDYLILESDGSTASGQLTGGAGKISISGDAYFDLMINAKNHKWYGVAVPWQVDATSGISVNGKTLVLGKDFDIVYYNGALRAEVGKQKCWSYVEDDGDKTLQPGRLYMIGLMMDAPQGIRFAKKAGASILTTTTSVTAHSGAAASTDQGWNGVANPALFHAYINPGVTAGQVYNPETNSYDPILMNDAKFVVGQGAFVEVEENKDITVTYGGAYAAAPRRARAEEAPLYDVRIAPAEAEYTDRLFVRVEDEKEADKYVIGKDLEKLGVSKSVAQMWINRYNTELCLNTMTIENGAAEYPLGIFAPKAGEYTISSQSSVFSDQYTLYLTRNGEAIWNLSNGAYTGSFEKGTDSSYGLRVSAKAPQITTGIDEAVVDAKGETRKVLIDNQVFITRGENVYSVDGQLVK